MPRLAYILSASHSGSTLLAMLLGAHPKVCTVGELKAGILETVGYRCSCRQFIKECSFWNSVNESMHKRGFPDFVITNAGTSIYDVPGRYAQRLVSPLYRSSAMEYLRDTALTISPSWRKHLRQTQARNLALISSLQEQTKAEWIVDSSKVALRLKYLLQIPRLEIRVLRLIRDGRAVALTYTDEATFADASDPALRGGGNGEQRPPAQGNMKDAANEWKRSNEAADALVARLPRSQWNELRYEDLCRNPEATLRRLCEFLGVDPAKVDLNFRARQQHVVGNGMRLDTTSEICLDERWRTHLSAEDLATFDRVAGELNRKYGYT